MTSVRLNPLDSAWLFTESRATPNHVGGLLQFRLPEGAPKDYMRKMMAEFRGHREFTAPWNRRLKYAFNKNPVPVWIEDRNIDLEYHVRHAALPWPGGERELGELIGRLQSTPLDLSRPPWECTLIEGLEGDRFALFIKMHHSLIDGVSGMKLLQGAMSPDREASRKLPPFWASGLRRSRRSGAEALLPTVANAAALAVEALRGQVQTVPQLVVAFGRMLKGLGTGEGMIVPFTSPQSVLNGRVREKRRFATQQFPMERLRSLAREAECTLNDIVLAICGGALFAWLVAGIEPAAFREQLQTALKLGDFLVASVKSVTFGLCVGVVGCALGLRVEGGSEGVGRATTNAVVLSIFLVIVVDTIFVTAQRMVLA